MLHEQFDHAATDLFVVCEAIEPYGEFVATLNVPRGIIPSTA